MGESIQRNIDRDILTAKGLTRKRKKEDRTPRVHKRNQYNKMMVAHRKKVQDFKEGPQALYAGHKDGIRAGISKSTKLNWTGLIKQNYSL